MKFSITAASIFAFAFLSTAVRADSASTAIDEFCGGNKIHTICIKQVN
jgi:hypothetical protein